MMNDFILKKILILFFLTVVSHSLFSQQFHWFSHQKGDAPFLAEMYASTIRLDLVKFNTLHPLYYKNSEMKRPFTEIQLGFQIPIVAFEKNWNTGTLKASFSTPFSALTLVDIFDRVTSPLINVDFRFGTKVQLIFSPKDSNQRFIKNYHLTLVPIFHESTHIGDELALHGYVQNPDFYRINLSYEAWQVFVGFNRLHNHHKSNLSVEVGYQRLMSYKAGYYDIDSLEVKGKEILFSKKRDVWILRAEYSYSFLFQQKRLNEVIASAELRRESKLGYTADNPEKQTWSLNFYAGYRIAVHHSHRHIGIYYRHYRGVVPYGQFRDRKDFVLNGVSIIFN